MGFFQPLSPEFLSFPWLALIFAGFYILYIFSVAVHRLYLSPYAKFPGPRIAGLTYGYLFYYDALGAKGQYMYKIQQLHEEYNSPIIRISPHELHVNDPDFYDILFSGASSKRDKPPTWSKAFGTGDSIFGTIDHETHRLRRSALSPFFSSASLRRMEPLIQDNISRLVAVFRRYQATGEVLHIKPAFSALTSDVITEYCFGITENYIEAKEFNALFQETVELRAGKMHVAIQWPWFPILLNKLPDWAAEILFGKGMANFRRPRQHAQAKIKEIIRTRDDYSNMEHKTIFHALLNNRSLSEEDKSLGRLSQESQLLLVAGTVTTAITLASAIVYLLLDEKRLIVLVEELEKAIPDITRPAKEAELEALPYLSAVIKETHRLTSGVSYRLTRSAPSETLQLGKWQIPPNTAISMHGPLIHHSPRIYPEPWSFIPERWLDYPPPSSSHDYLPPRPKGIPRANSKYLVPFSRGTRNCIAQPLAHAELFMTLANVLRAFVRLKRDTSGAVTGVKGMKWYETDRRDTDMKSDLGFPFPQQGRGDMRIILE